MKGSKVGFDELSREYQEEARRFIRLKLGAALRQRVDSSDVLQEAFLEAARFFPKASEEGKMTAENFLPWIKKIITNKIKNLARHHLETEARSVRREIKVDSDCLAAPTRTPSREFLEAERAHIIEESLQELAPREREVVILVHLEKLGVPETARRLGKTANSTAVLLHRALVKLGEILRRRDK